MFWWPVRGAQRGSEVHEGISLIIWSRHHTATWIQLIEGNNWMNRRLWERRPKPRCERTEKDNKPVLLWSEHSHKIWTTSIRWKVKVGGRFCGRSPQRRSLEETCADLISRRLINGLLPHNVPLLKEQTRRLACLPQAQRPRGCFLSSVCALHCKTPEKFVFCLCAD